MKTEKNKQELISEVEAIPKFILREIYVKEGEDYLKEPVKKAVTETEIPTIIETVSKGYKLIQFEEVYKPIIENYPDLTGEVSYYKGKAILTIYPSGDNFLTEDNHKIGVLIANSVDKKIAVNINFCILYNGYKVVLPTGINGLSQKHIGNVKEIVKEYEKFLTDIKGTWKTIISKFNRKLAEGEIDGILTLLSIRKNQRKKIEANVDSQNATLWDLFLTIVRIVSDKKYRNNVNKVNRLKQICELVYKYAVVEVM